MVLLENSYEEIDMESTERGDWGRKGKPIIHSFQPCSMSAKYISFTHRLVGEEIEDIMEL